MIALIFDTTIDLKLPQGSLYSLLHFLLKELSLNKKKNYQLALQHLHSLLMQWLT